MNTNRRALILAVTLGLILASAAITQLTRSAIAQEVTDFIENEEPARDNFTAKVPQPYMEQKSVRKLDWLLVKNGYAFAAAGEPCGAFYAGYAGSKKLERIVFQFVIADEDTWDQKALAARMDALLKIHFEDIPADAWAYQAVTADGKTSHICTDGKWSTD